MFRFLFILSPWFLHDGACQEDVTLADAVCRGHCDEPYFPGRPCYCNSDCAQFENCCYDFYQECRPDFVWSEEWMDFDGHSYKYFADTTITAVTAEVACRRLGALLLSITSQEEQEFVSLSVLRRRTLSAFIGGRRNDEGTWMWADGMRMALPTDPWHEWFEGQSDSVNRENCSVISNYRFWHVRPLILPSYVWRPHGCTNNPANEIQGYVCERSLRCSPNPCENNGTCAYVGGASEVTCLCPENYVGDLCQYQVIPGESWTICGDTNLTGLYGVITSPLHPQNYPALVRCQWILEAKPGHTISLRLERLDIEDSKDCTFDRLTIYDGLNKSGEVLLPPACGDLDNHVTSFSSSTNQVLVEMRTDENVQDSGFSLSYTQQECGRGVGDSRCNSPRVFTLPCGRIEISSGPNANSVCDWLINVDEDHVIEMYFSEFQIQDTGMACETGLSIRDGSSSSGILIGQFCGKRFPWRLVTSGNRAYLRLSDVTWSTGDSIVMDYKALPKDNYTSTERSVVEGREGSISTTLSPPHSVHVTMETYRWLLRVPQGDRITLSVQAKAYIRATLKVYDGYSEESTLRLDLVLYDPELGALQTHEIDGGSFQLLVVFQHSSDDELASLNGTFVASEWNPERSGCYQPEYFSQSHGTVTEHTTVRSLEPVVVMVTKDAYTRSNPGYDAGPFCGKRDVNDLEIMTSSSHVTLVFYSDTRGSRRRAGLLKALVTTNNNSCPVFSMDTEKTKSLDASCGVFLSPWLGGLVAPGEWTWIITSPAPGSYITANVYYVTGPGVMDEDCRQYFQLLEIPQAALNLRQYESVLFKTCGDTTSFIPPRQIKVPPSQKLGIEINTAHNTLSTRWQFKVSFTISTMEQPPKMDDGTVCPPEYSSYDGSCYRYYNWVLRHYRPDEYSFQGTWQNSEQQCESEGGNLVSFHSLEELYFVKYALAHQWLTDPAACYMVDHRFIYIGLTNKETEYRWTDDTALGYSEWYQPPAPWDIDPVYPDTQIKDILYLSKPQPSADTASLCTIMMNTVPFASANWAKIPCDYPIFRAGQICKVKGNITEVQSNQTDSPEELFTACPSGWFLMNNKCYHMHTNYKKLESNDNETSNLLMEGIQSMSYDDASIYCRQIGGSVAPLSDKSLQHFETYLDIWRHTREFGDIWLSSNFRMGHCNIIQVYKLHPQDDRTLYRLVEISCMVTAQELPNNVLCVTDAIVREETCGAHEFHCGNDQCVSVDHVCDGSDDCLDGSDEQQCGCGQHMFECANGRCVSVSLYCDGNDNCGDNSDEEFCVPEVCGPNQFTCDNKRCIPMAKLCDFRTDCTDASDEGQICETDCRGFLCFSGTCLALTLQKDSVSDCPGLSMEDELSQGEEGTFFDIYRIGGTLESNDSVSVGCLSGDGVPCTLDQPSCYPRARACHYDTHVTDDVTGYTVQSQCRDGAHLRVNCGDVSCPGMFHCPGSYCLPYHKRCDGTRDCPRGEDESKCDTYTCPGMFKCKGSRKCINHDEVCDGVVHCTHREDEKYCNTSDVLCTDTCICSGYIAYCSDRNLTRIPSPLDQSLRQLRSLVLSGNQIALANTSFLHLHWLAKLNLANNKLGGFPSGLFVHLKNLLELDLSDNHLAFIAPDAFEGLVSLQKLNLDYNRLTTLHPKTLSFTVSLRVLNITSNKLQGVTEEVFNSAPGLRVLHTDAYKFCCVAKHVETCTPEADAFSSCEDLMSNSALQVSIWVLGILAFSGNIFVIVWRIRRERSRVSSFFIINLGASDFLMGIYMLIIAGVDVHYRGVYIVYADSWRASVLCQTAGVIAMLSSEVSVFMMTAITMERLVTILFPLKMGSLRMSHARKVAAGGWVACLVLSLLPLTNTGYFGESFFGRTGVCLPFQITSEKLPGWEYSVFVFLVLNLISFIAIFIGYILIFVNVRSSVKAMGAQSTNALNEYDLAKKLALVVGTDFLCWVPIILIGFAALGGAAVPPQVSAWIAVFILPLNSAVNPILYTISAIDCNKRKTRQANSMATSTYGRSTMTSVHAPVSRVSNKETVVPLASSTAPLATDLVRSSGQGKKAELGSEVTHI